MCSSSHTKGAGYTGHGRSKNPMPVLGNGGPEDSTNVGRLLVLVRRMKAKDGPELLVGEVRRDGSADTDGSDGGWNCWKRPYAGKKMAESVGERRILMPCLIQRCEVGGW